MQEEASSTTAAAGDRPKGLGSSPALPSKKRPGSAKPGARNVRPRDNGAKKVICLDALPNLVAS